MNIQQLNGNGKPLQAFISTSIVALVITGGTWFFIEEINSYRYWHSKRSEQEQTVKSKFSPGERIAMIAWLLRNDKLSWMRKSGAWWRIPFNNGTAFVQDPEFRGRNLSVSDYVSKYSQWKVRDRVRGDNTVFDEHYIRRRASVTSVSSNR